MDIKEFKLINIILIFIECYVAVLTYVFDNKVILVFFTLLLLFRTIINYILRYNLIITEVEIELQEDKLKFNYLLDNLSLYLFIFNIFSSNILVSILLIAALRVSSGNDRTQEKIRSCMFLIYVIYFGLEAEKIILLIISITVYYIILPKFLDNVILDKLSIYKLETLLFWFKIIVSFRTHLPGKIIYYFMLYLMLYFAATLYGRDSHISFLITNIFLLLLMLLERNYIKFINEPQLWSLFASNFSVSYFDYFFENVLSYLTKNERKKDLYIYNVHKAEYNFLYLKRFREIELNARSIWANNFMFYSGEGKIICPNIEQLLPHFYAILLKDTENIISPRQLDNTIKEYKYLQSQEYKQFLEQIFLNKEFYIMRIEKTSHFILPKSPIFYANINYFLLTYCMF